MPWFDFKTWSRRPTYALTVGIAGFEMIILAWALSPDADLAYRAYFIDRATTCLDKPIPETYQLGSTVSFLPDGRSAADPIRVCGWSNPVGNGTHSIGESSRLRLMFDVPPGDLTVVVMLTSSRPQRVVVSANDTVIGQTFLPGSEAEVEGRFRVSHELAALKKSLDIEFEYPDAFLPNLRTSNTHSRAIRLLAFRVVRS